MARIENSVVIERPIEEVFEFVTNPRIDTLWNPEVIETVATSESPIGVGTTLRSTASFLGRRFDMTLEVTEHEPNKKQCVGSVSGPLTFTGCYVVEPDEVGTRFTQTSEVEGLGFFKLAASVVVRAMNRHIEVNLATLKDILEARG